MLRHIPVLAKEIFDHLPKNLTTYFDGTFGHGGHTEYILSHAFPPYEGVQGGFGGGLHITACDLDPTIMQKGLTFTEQRKKQITPIIDTYAHIDQI